MHALVDCSYGEFLGVWIPRLPAPDDGSRFCSPAFCSPGLNPDMRVERWEQTAEARAAVISARLTTFSALVLYFWPLTAKNQGG
jgi:hypothetical protein